VPNQFYQGENPMVFNNRMKTVGIIVFFIMVIENLVKKNWFGDSVISVVFFSYEKIVATDRAFSR